MKTIDPTLTGHMKNCTLGSRMRASREHARLKIKEAAPRIGISPGQLGRIERGAVGMVSDPRTLSRAAGIYGVSDVWLYAGGIAGRKLIPEWYAPAQVA